jgi:hypothetical protein
MISTQFVRTADGWKMSAMAWDDERAGLVIPERFALSDRQHLVRGGAADA